MHVHGYVGIAARVLSLACLAFLLSHGGKWEPRWLLVLPPIVAERVTSVWRLGWRERAIAIAIVPDEAYEILRGAYLVAGLVKHLGGREVVWE